MLRIIAIVIALWGLVASPALCAGGVLLHACPDTEEHSGSHDDECAADPCTDCVAGPQTTVNVIGRLVTMTARLARTTPNDDRLIAARGQAEQLTTTLRRNLPMPVDDLPLLI